MGNQASENNNQAADQVHAMKKISALGTKNQNECTAGAVTTSSANKTRRTERHPAEIRITDFPLNQKGLDLKYRGHRGPSFNDYWNENLDLAHSR
jgi:hypothetical protein